MIHPSSGLSRPFQVTARKAVIACYEAPRARQSRRTWVTVGCQAAFAVGKREKLRMLKVLRVISLPILLLVVCGFTECYKPVTKSQLPPHIKTVAVPAFQNNALRFKIEHRFTQAVMNELIHRGHGIRVQSEREGADAVIDGVVKSFGFSGVLLDDKGRARIFEVTITAAVTVRDQHDNRVLYDNQNFIFRGEFEFANDPRNFFNEEDPAVMRIARSFAESIVSTLINGFGVKEDK